MAAPHQHFPPTTTTLPSPPQSQPTSSTATATSTSTHQRPQPSQPPVELDSHPITPPPPSATAHQHSTSSTDHDNTERRTSIYSDPESMAKLRAERSSDPAVVDGPAANEPAAEEFAVAAGLERGMGDGN